MPQLWGWVALATYMGNRSFHHHDYDLWEYVAGDITLALVVDKNDANRPVIYERRTPTEEVTVMFTTWSTDKPKSSYFDVPHECNKTATITKPGLKLN